MRNRPGVTRRAIGYEHGVTPRPLGPDFVVVVTPDGHVVCSGEHTHLKTPAGSHLEGWTGMLEVIEEAAERVAVGEITAPDGRRGRVVAQPLTCATDHAPWVLVASTAPGAGAAADVVSEALELVREADAALDARDQELHRLQVLAERLVQLGPPTVVVDDRRRIRAWSVAAERLCGLPAEKALGRPLAAVLPGLDLAASLEGEAMLALDGQAVRVSAEVIDPGHDDVLLVLNG